MGRTYVVGTRKSSLAVTQTKWVIEALKQKHPDVLFEMKYIETEGDRKLDVALTSFGTKGVFITELEELLRNKTIDFAVHSLKDIPLIEDDEFIIASIPKREDARDAYIHKDDVPLTNLRKGSVIGTSSERRRAQLKAAYPELETKWIRGPVDSRLEQMRRGDFDGIILAVAGLKRLGLENVITEYLPIETFTPAAGQGALAVQCRKDDSEVIELLQAIDDVNAHRSVIAERHVMKRLDEEDQAPIGAYAYVKDEKLHLFVSVLAKDGSNKLECAVTGTDPIRLAEEAAIKLIEQGAESIIQEAKEE